MTLVDLAGKVYGRLTVVGRSDRKEQQANRRKPIRRAA